MFAKFEVLAESETVESTGLSAIGRFHDGYHVTENLVYRALTVNIRFDSDPNQAHPVVVRTLGTQGEPEIVLDRLVSYTLEDGRADDRPVTTFGLRGPAIYYLEARSRRAPSTGWTRVPPGLIDPMILQDLKV